jgi:acetylxylan esterase
MAFTATVFWAIALSSFPFITAQNFTAGSSLQNTTSSTACAPLHIIVVRASTERPSQGIIGTLSNLITTALPSTTVEWIHYPARLMPDYPWSAYNGTMNATKQLTEYVDRCGGSNGKEATVVLMGYSQGAQVIGDVMCGGGGSGLGVPGTNPVDQKYQDAVKAIVQMGDPRFVASKTYDFGSATMDGVSFSCSLGCDRRNQGHSRFMLNMTDFRETSEHQL